MIRLVRLYTGEDGQSHVEEGTIPLSAGKGDDLISSWAPVTHIRFQESPAGSSFDWHNAPCRQYVITLSGTLEFITRNGERFQLKPGDVLLAEDTSGGGHCWRLIDDQPWRRVYVQLPMQNEENKS
jgi:mannose-6-phosphate isomerase-like protein (cupin superfamily)